MRSGPGEARSVESAEPEASESLPRRLQRRLGALYGIDAPPIDAFVRPANDAREAVSVRQSRRALDIAVHLPESAIRPTRPLSLDVYCQAIEGVSHFLLLVERARRRLPATLFELELQAEVDKFVIVAEHAAVAAKDHVRERLFGGVRYLHDEATEPGQRYRLANQLAARFVGALPAEEHPSKSDRTKRTLLRFWGAGQREKIEMVMAA